MASPRPIPGYLWTLQLAENLNVRIAPLVRSWPSFDKARLGDQLYRAVDSIGLNISEGYARTHLKERVHFLSMASGSVEESLFAIRRARDRELISRLEASILSGLLIKLSNAIDSLVRALMRQTF
jgi:four helix bundle protein